jgi:hypothetical protein
MQNTYVQQTQRRLTSLVYRWMLDGGVANGFSKSIDQRPRYSSIMVRNTRAGTSIFDHLLWPAAVPVHTYHCHGFLGDGDSRTIGQARRPRRVV